MTAPALPPPRRRERGRSLVETLAVLALVGLLGAGTVSAVSRALELGRLRSACRHLGLLLRRARAEATGSGRQVGLVFRRDDGWSWTVHVDGNGNGIRTRDVRAGVDRQVSGPHRVEDQNPGVVLAILPPPPIPLIPPEPGDLDRLDDPVKFGPVDIVSFSPDGTASHGTLYLSHGPEHLGAVRLNGTTSRLSYWEYDPHRRRWQRH